MIDSSWEDAIQKGKLRIDWKFECPDDVDTHILMRTLYNEARQQRPAPNTSQDEHFVFLSLQREGNTYRFKITYIYDYDFHSMYDLSQEEQIILIYAPLTPIVILLDWKK